MGGRLIVEPSWRCVAATATGTSHRERDEPGQDAFASAELDDGRVVIAVADGAGSAPLAAEGSRVAVDVAIAAITAGAAMEDAFDAAACGLGEDADARSARATTLLVAVLGPDELSFGQVGDGYIVVREDDRYLVANAGGDREYLNETTFLSSSRWRDDLRVGSMPASAIDAVAVMTDGIQLVAIDLAAGEPFSGFFDPLFRWAASDDADPAELAAFLASPRLAARTDDDVTLALAVPRARPE